MKRLLFIFVLLSVMVDLSGQNYYGTVKDGKSKHVLDFVSIVVFDASDNPICYKQTDENGKFSVSVPADKKASKLVISCLGYAKTAIPVDIFDNGKTYFLKEEANMIREVVVKSKRLQQRNDTLEYSVAGFRQKQDKSIADVISKMPGMDVESDGTIKYQGKAINKFYIEGMDLMGGKYSMASENISASKVKKVQVLQHHQPIKSLRNIQFSDHAALNIVLTDDAKSVCSAAVEIGAGSQLQKTEGEALLRDGRIVAMDFGRKLQNMSMYKWNNTGRDIQHEIRDLTNDELGQADEAEPWLDDISISAPDLKLERYNYNDTRILATNLLRKINNDRSLRLQSTYLFDKTIGYRYDNTVYSNILGHPAIEEETEADKFRRETKSELQYKVNGNNIYLNDVLQLSLNWNQSDATTLLNGVATHQMVQPRKRSISNNLRVIKNIKNNRSLSFNMQLNYQYLPGLLSLGDSASEKMNLSMLSAKMGTGFRHKLFGMYISYDAQLDYSRQSAELFLAQRSKLDYECLNAILTPSVSYGANGLNVSANFPFRESNYVLGGKHEHGVYVEPHLSFQYKINSMLDFDINYSRQYSPYDFKTSVPLSYYSNYITMQEGTGHLGHLDIDGINSGINYENPINGFFFNAKANYSHIDNMPLYASSIIGNVYKTGNTGMYSSNESYNASAELSKAYGMGKTVFTLGGESMWNKYHMLISDILNSCQLHTMDAYFKLAISPCGIFSIEEKSSLYYSIQQNYTNPALSSKGLKSFKHELRLFFMPGNWRFEWTNELYHGNDRSVNTAYFSDASCGYKNKSFDINLMLDNIFGTKEYDRYVVTGEYMQQTINRLRPREILVKVGFYL